MTDAGDEGSPGNPGASAGEINVNVEISGENETRPANEIVGEIGDDGSGSEQGGANAEVASAVIGSEIAMNTAHDASVAAFDAKEETAWLRGQVEGLHLRAEATASTMAAQMAALAAMQAQMAEMTLALSQLRTETSPSLPSQDTPPEVPPETPPLESAEDRKAAETLEPQQKRRRHHIL